MTLVLTTRDKMKGALPGNSARLLQQQLHVGAVNVPGRHAAETAAACRHVGCQQSGWQRGAVVLPVQRCIRFKAAGPLLRAGPRLECLNTCNSTLYLLLCQAREAKAPPARK